MLLFAISHFSGNEEIFNKIFKDLQNWHVLKKLSSRLEKKFINLEFEVFLKLKFN